MTTKSLGYKTVPLKSIIVGGDYDMAKRLKSDSVRTLAASLKTYGQLAPCGVVPAEGGRYTLWYGGDRYAAALLAEFDKLDVKVWEADDRGALELQLVENCHRRHDQSEQAAARQALIELYGEEVEKENLPPEKAKQEVVRRVAEAMGVQPSSVERAERRRRRKEVLKEQNPVRTISKQVDTLGVEMSADWNAWLADYKEPFVTATDHMTRAQMNIGRALKKLGNNCPAAAAALMRLHDEVHAVLVKVRGAVPASVCPYCKALDGALDRCAGCGSSSVVSEAQLAQCPRELLETGKHACIYVDGRKYLVSEWEQAHGSEDVAQPAGDVEASDGDSADWGDL